MKPTIGPTSCNWPKKKHVKTENTQYKSRCGIGKYLAGTKMKMLTASFFFSYVNFEVWRKCETVAPHLHPSRILIAFPLSLQSVPVLMVTDSLTSPSSENPAQNDYQCNPGIYMSLSHDSQERTLSVHIEAVEGLTIPCVDTREEERRENEKRQEQKLFFTVCLSTRHLTKRLELNSP